MAIALPAPPAPPLRSDDPVEAAHAAGLRYVDVSAMAGLRRVRRGKHFDYIDASGRRVRDAAVLERIRKLVIPPAWEAVWICAAANGHIQAAGRDKRGRKQYRYHARWREVRDANKYGKLLAFARALPRIRAACDRNLRLTGLPRAKVLSTVVRLLDLTHIRVGNEEYVRDNGSYGLTTLRDWHVRVRGATLTFHFRGKSGKVHEIGLREPRLARIVAKCSELPGHELFQYLDERGERHSIGSSDVNEYIRAIAREEFTAKDFRTWAGTVLAARVLCALGRRGRPAKDIASCIKSVAAHLGNTPAVCRRCYVHPSILDSYADGTMHELHRKGMGGEAFVRMLLERASSTTEEERLTKTLRASVGQLQLRRRQHNRGGLHSPDAR